MSSSSSLPRRGGASRRGFLSATAGLASSVFLVRRATAGEKDPKYVIKLGTAASAGTPWEAHLKKWAKRVKEATNGEVKIKAYWGGALGDEQTVADRVADGSVQAYGGTGGGLNRRIPEFEVFELPYLFPSLAKADKALDGLYDTIDGIAQQRGYKLMFFSENGHRSIGMKGGFAKSPSALSGKKMRSQPTQVYLDTWKSWGASPQAMAVTEVMSALTAGTIDGFDNTPLFTFASSWYQGITHYTLTEHSYQPGFVLVSKKFWDDLPKDIQDILLGDAIAEGQRGRKGVRKIEPLLLKNFETANIAVYKPTEAEKKAFAAASAGVKDKFAARQGESGKALLKALQSKL